MAWAPDYVTAGELADYARIGDGADDVVLRLAVAAASRAVDRTCGRQFGLADEVAPRYYTARWWPDRARRAPLWWVQIDDLTDELDLTVSVEGGEVTDYTLRPRNAEADGMSWTELLLGEGVTPSTNEPDNVRVTARFGWQSVPDAVRQATLMQGSRLLARRDSPFGVAGSPDQGSEMRLLARVDPDVAVTLRHYRRHWLGV